MTVKDLATPETALDFEIQMRRKQSGFCGENAGALEIMHATLSQPASSRAEADQILWSAFADMDG